MKKLLIIPARTGSKRIPNKNFKEFLGKPLIQYAIEKAIASNVFDEVMVSTNDNEAAELCRNYGASVPFLRSEKNSNDFATTADVVAEVIDCYVKLGQEYDLVCCLYATSVLLQSDQLVLGVKTMYGDPGLDSLLSVVKYPHPPERALILDQKGNIKLESPEAASIRTQDLETKYYDAGQFYIMRTASFMKSKKIVGENCGYIEFTELEVQDLDDMDDWSLAEKKFEFLNYLKRKTS